MKIGIITTNSFPIPYKTHTGDIVILDLALSLHDLGHEITLYAPEGSVCYDKKINVIPTPCSYGRYNEHSRLEEKKFFEENKDHLFSNDIMHDFSESKMISHYLYNSGYQNILFTLMGGAWTKVWSPYNPVAWSQSHRDRILRGASDYENTLMPEVANQPYLKVKETHVVSGGIDTNFYTPTYDKKNFFLWMNRWHPAKGYREAIKLAQKTGIELIMAGEYPENETFASQRDNAIEAVKLAKNCKNIKFHWLPKDPYHHITKRELYRQAKALLYTVQFNEPFGLSQVESLSCGTPVIGVNYGSVPEIIKDGEVGFVRNNDINQLATSIDLIENINPERCRQEAIDKYDRSVMAKSYIREYNFILNNQGWT